MYHILKARPVWGENTGVDTYLLFRNKFQWDGSADTILEISADSTFEIAVNGKALAIQQLADYPDNRTFSTADITEYLIKGENLITVNIHYIGENFLTYQIGVPYLQAVIYSGEKIFSATGDSWEYAADGHYRSGLRQKVTVQLGFTFEYDAAEKNLVFSPAVPAFPVGSLSPRQVPQLEELPVDETIVQCFGVLRREKELESAAQSCAADYLQAVPYAKLFSSIDLNGAPYTTQKFRFDGKQKYTFLPVSSFDGANGYYITADLGRETVGYLAFSLQAPAGTIVDVAHGEHLDDGRVRALGGSRKFTDRYICRDGVNNFICRHRRLGARYLEMHISNFSGGEVTVTDLKLIPVEIPLAQQAAFDCEDRALLRLNKLSADTLKLCMHEHYEDCPWREQGLYAYDSRNQILYGYYLWGNYDFVEASLYLLGQSFDGERYLTLTAPGKHELTIPIFTLVWISELYEFQLFSGSSRLFERLNKTVDKIIDKALSEKVPGHPEFYHSGTGKGIWNFCEWQGHLDHVNGHPQSVYNIFLYEALNAAAALHRMAGNIARTDELTQKADALGKALQQKFRGKDGYNVYLQADDDPKLYEHIQSLFLANGLVPEEKTAELIEKFRSGEMYQITFSSLRYLLHGLLNAGKEGRKYLVEKLMEIFDPVIFSNATSIGETANAGDDFGFAGSLCHGWSAISPYFCGRVLLGVSPLLPGFKRFEVKPYCAHLSRAEGDVPTPYGMIHIKWYKIPGGGLNVTVQHPEGLECVITSWEEFPVTEKNVKSYKN